MTVACVMLTLSSWKAAEDACTLAIDLYKVDGDDADVCARVCVKFKENEHLAVWSAVLEWAVNAKVRKFALQP